MALSPVRGAGVGVGVEAFPRVQVRSGVWRSLGKVSRSAAPAGEREYGVAVGVVGVDGRVKLEANSRACVLSAPTPCGLELCRND